MKKILFPILLLVASNAFSQDDKLKSSRLEPFTNHSSLRLVTTQDTAVIYQDSKGNQFRYDPTDTKSPDDSVMVVVRRDGKRLKRVYTDRVFVSWFGAKAGDKGDDWFAIQKAINFVISHNEKTKTVVFDELGIYNISAPLICYSWDGSEYDFFQINLVGASSGKMPVASQSTQLSATFNDKFIIGMHKTRASTIQNILMVGNYTHKLSQKQAWESKREAWRNPSGRDSEYSPYAGIAIDPFAGSLPPDRGYPGLTEFYRGPNGSSGSSGIDIKNCYIAGFVVGVVISPNHKTQNAENVNIVDCRIETCMSAIAYTQTQTKGNFVRNLVTWGTTHTVIDCVNYGVGTGYPPYVEGVNVAGTCHQVFDVSTTVAATSPVYARDIFAEGLFKIGRIGNNGTPNKRQSVIENSDFHLAQYAYANVGDADRPLAGDNILLKGCQIINYHGTADPSRLNFSGQNVQFQNCVFNSPPISAETSDITLNIRPQFFNCRMYSTNNSFGNITQQSFDINTETKGMPLAGLETETVSGTAGITYKFSFTEPLDENIYIGKKMVLVDPVNNNVKIVMGENARIIQVNDYIVCDFGSTVKDSLLYGVVDRNPSLGRVTKVTNDTVYLGNVPVSVKRSGMRNIYLNHYKRVGALWVGDVEEGSDIISNVEVYKNLWPAVGDRFDITRGLPGNKWIQGSFITAIDKPNKRIRISNAFEATQNHIDFHTGNPKITARAWYGPEAHGGTVFHFGGAEWNVMANQQNDSAGHRYAILRTGPYNSALHPHKSVKIIPAASSGGGGVAMTIDTGRYTPRFVNAANIDAPAARGVVYWERQGNRVRVWGSVNIDAVKAKTITKLGIPLPLSSNFSNFSECSGTASTGDESNYYGQVTADVSNKRAELKFFTNTDTAPHIWSFNFSYVIIGNGK